MNTPDRTPDDADKRKAAIRDANDALRRTFEGGRVMMTSGVTALSAATQVKVIQAVRSFDDFSEDNDPHLTHDFGMVEIDGKSLMWKIDAYDNDLQYGSPDESDPSVTTRVMTILLASEY